ncbi:carbohydrate ABC transporter permease [Haploplasma axanthum]|uniref:sn-glycerol-3-phosphate transport system permease protein ugpA n=1 Tax=Haploplasma axanthum TaxID=29552 RepID=A0A449BC76_HAPAX|nr:sugar ABC transporter permease [Haploplasma axanthum]VEU80049.1 sn-glycerol-3-phosphate transport system permease protein ugpA [Haploplasma axanthum]
MLEKKTNKAWLYLLPAIIVLIIFTIYPIINTFIISFDYKYNADQAAFGFDWGLKSYQSLMRGSFVSALWNTVLIVVISVPLSTFVALLVAIALNSIKPFQKIFQTIFFTPYVTNTIAIGMVFALMFSSTDGIINNIFGISKDWIGLNSSYISKMFVLQLYILWNGLAFKVLILLGGLQSINKQYYDAAKIDGTSKGRIFRKITIPLLSPTLSYIITTSLIGAFKTYDVVISLFDAKGQRDMRTVVGFVYDTINGGSPYSVGAAGAIILFVIILLVTGVNQYINKKAVHY